MEEGNTIRSRKIIKIGQMMMILIGCVVVMNLLWEKWYSVELRDDINIRALNNENKRKQTVLYSDENTWKNLDLLNKMTFEGKYLMKKNGINFKRDHGKIILNFSYINYHVYTLFTIDYILTDGDYKEKWITMKQEFTIIPSDPKKNDIVCTLTDTAFILSNEIENSDRNEKMRQVITRNLFKSVNQTKVIVEEFTIDFKLDNDDTFHPFKTIKGNTLIKALPLEFTYDVREVIKDNQSDNTTSLDIFSLIITSIAFFNIYCILSTVRDCMTQKINPKSLSPYIIIFDMIWNADLSLCCIYLAITHRSKFVDFMLSAIIFFANFSVFQMNLLYLSYKNQDVFDNDQLLQNQELLKKRIVRFYSVLYGSILVSLFYLYFIVLYKLLMFMMIVITFLPQIYHNTIVSIPRNQIPLKVIILFTMNKLFIPIYMRLWPYNIIHSEPDVKFSLGSIGVIALQIIILILQAKYGALFIIPKKCRKGYYNYYKTFDQLITMNIDPSQTACAICFATLREQSPLSKTSSDISIPVAIQQEQEIEHNQVESSIQSSPLPTNHSDDHHNNDTTLIVSNSHSNSSPPKSDMSNHDTIPIITTSNNTNNIQQLQQNPQKSTKKKKKKCCFNINICKRNKKSFKNNTKTEKGKIMLTPCHHSFHYECLKKWCIEKNKCPICRETLPLIY